MLKKMLFFLLAIENLLVIFPEIFFERFGCFNVAFYLMSCFNYISFEIGWTSESDSSKRHWKGARIQNDKKMTRKNNFEKAVISQSFVFCHHFLDYAEMHT